MTWGQVLVCTLLGVMIGAGGLVAAVVVVSVREFWKELFNK